jgi:glyoxylate reductase
MTKPRVFVARSIPEPGLQLIRTECEPDVWPLDEPPPKEEMLHRVRGVEGLLSLLTDCVDSEIMDAAPNLRVISNMAVGVDNIDLAEATRRHVPVGNTPDVLTDATADLAFALLLAVARRVVEGVEYTRAGKWKTWNLQLLLGADLFGSTLGIIGFGRIGQAVAKRATGFGMKTIFHDPHSEPDSGARGVSLEEVLQLADFVTLHVPLTVSTRHMINERTLRMMKRTAILINTARGPIVDHDALATALRSGVIGAAALDVTEPEPINPDSPLLQLSNCVIVPHLGSASRRTREQMAILAGNNLLAGLKGRRLPHCVNPEVYDDG